MKNIAIALVIGLAIGGALGWFLKADRVIIQNQKTLDQEHVQGGKREADHDQRKEEVEQGIRRAGTHLGDCDRAPANADILQTLDQYPRRSHAR